MTVSRMKNAARFNVFIRRTISPSWPSIMRYAGQFNGENRLLA